MALQRLTCAEATGDALVHVCDPCNNELGRVRSVILFDAGFDTTPLQTALKLGTTEGDAQAVTLFEAAISNGNAHLISETNGTYDGGSPQTGDGYGDEDTRLLGYLHTLSFKDPSYAGNAKFWENAEKSKWKVCFRTDTLLHFIDKPASIQAIAPIEADLTSSVAWNVTAAWKSAKKPEIVPSVALQKYFQGCWVEEDSGSN